MLQKKLVESKRKKRPKKDMTRSDCKSKSKCSGRSCDEEGESVKANISVSDLLELVFLARRYCDGRSSYSSIIFNNIYARIQLDNPEFMEQDIKDFTLSDSGRYWPYAHDALDDDLDRW